MNTEMTGQLIAERRRELGSWNFGNSREAVIIFCGGDLPEDAAYYTFRNSGITYTCPIKDRQVLDIFLLPDTRDISSYPEILVDQNGEPLEGVFEGESQEETPDESSLKVQE